MMDNCTPLVSVIIPVFNVEPYLRQCLDSVINQTYKNLEILIIDDGSIDGCGTICDEYKKDSRVTVFHTENRGLSAARNLGVDNATGDYISFIDSDDWFEENAIEKTVEVAVETEADIVCFRYVREYRKPQRKKTIIGSSIKVCFTGNDIVRAFCEGKSITDTAWDKVYRKQLFANIRFPEGRDFEDIATTHKMVLKATLIVCISDIFIHYRVRKRSITQSHSLNNCEDYWVACIERYNDMQLIADENGNLLIGSCINAIGRMWRWYSQLNKVEKENAQILILEMQDFVKKHLGEVLRSTNISLVNKALCICTMTRNPIEMKVLNLINSIYRRLAFHGKHYE